MMADSVLRKTQGEIMQLNIKHLKGNIDHYISTRFPL